MRPSFTDQISAYLDDETRIMGIPKTPPDVNPKRVTVRGYHGRTQETTATRKPLDRIVSAVILRVKEYAGVLIRIRFPS